MEGQRAAEYAAVPMSAISWSNWLGSDIVLAWGLCIQQVDPVQK
jgi:hypothetical protein